MSTATSSATRGSSSSSSSATQFSSAFTDLQLLRDVIPAVAAVANPVAPGEATMAAWNGARAAGGHGAAPSAEAIHLRFNKRVQRNRKLSWSEIVAGACGSTPPDRLLVLWSRREDLPVDQRHARYALQRVAKELGAESLSMEQYQRERRRLIKSSRPVSGRELLDELLPSAERISRLSGGWPAALRTAGLQPYKRTIRNGPRADGFPVAEAMAAFAEHNARLPRRAELRRFMIDCDARLAAEEGVPWSDQLDAAEELLRQRGLPVPAHRPSASAGPPPKAERGYRLPPGATIPGAPPRTYTYWTRERCLEALREYLSCLRPGEDGRQAEYRSMAAERDWPSPTTLRKYGTFQALLSEARQLPARA